MAYCLHNTIIHHNGFCVKPLAMMEHIIRTSSREGATVMDCFMGSGVTLEACRNLRRDGIGVELDEHWWGEACKRIAAPEPAAQLELVV